MNGDTQRSVNLSTDLRFLFLSFPVNFVLYSRCLSDHLPPENNMSCSCHLSDINLRLAMCDIQIMSPTKSSGNSCGISRNEDYLWFSWRCSVVLRRKHIFIVDSLHFQRNRDLMYIEIYDLDRGGVSYRCDLYIALWPPIIDPSV
jgi:hypothetical protein